MNRRFFVIALTAVVALPVFGDDWRRDRYEDRGGRYTDREDSGDNRGGFRNAALIERVSSDLRRIQYRGAPYNGGDRKHLERAIEDLDRFQYTLSSNRKFDHGKLDNAMDHMDKVMRASWLSKRDRDMINRNLYALRDFRGSGRGGSRYWRGNSLR